MSSYLEIVIDSHMRQLRKEHELNAVFRAAEALLLMTEGKFKEAAEQCLKAVQSKEQAKRLRQEGY